MEGLVLTGEVRQGSARLGSTHLSRRGPSIALAGLLFFNQSPLQMYLAGWGGIR